jgi:hypothetical protein
MPIIVEYMVKPIINTWIFLILLPPGNFFFMAFPGIVFRF